jgi:4-alpha-glucanotransferase
LPFKQFCDEQAHWLDDYALFRALKATTTFATSTGLQSWFSASRLWPGARGDLADQIQKFCFAQFLLFRQGARLRTCPREGHPPDW